jgi:transcriptional regulator with XRE-family HTH domain
MPTKPIGDKLRKLREESKLPLRKVAALLDIDVAILSKMERGERPLSKEAVMKLAKIYKHDADELTVLFLSQKIVDEVGEEDLALKAMQVAEEQIKYQRKQNGKK